MFAFVVACVVLQVATAAPNRNAVCVVGGDPFYTTLDGARLEFQGKCTYQLMQTKKSLPKDLEEFTVLVNNMKALGSERSYTDKVHIDIAYHRFSLRDNGQIMIDETDRTRDCESGTLTDISSSGKLKAWKMGPELFVKVDDAFTLMADLRGSAGRHVVRIFNVNPKYQGHIDGLCGNWDGSLENDHFPKGMRSHAKDVEVGNSYIVDGAECL